MYWECDQEIERDTYPARKSENKNIAICHLTVNMCSEVIAQLSIYVDKERIRTEFP